MLARRRTIKRYYKLILLSFLFSQIKLAEKKKYPINSQTTQTNKL